MNYGQLALLGLALFALGLAIGAFGLWAKRAQKHRGDADRGRSNKR